MKKLGVDREQHSVGGDGVGRDGRDGAQTNILSASKLVSFLRALREDVENRNVGGLQRRVDELFDEFFPMFRLEVRCFLYAKACPTRIWADFSEAERESLRALGVYAHDESYLDSSALISDGVPVGAWILFANPMQGAKGLSRRVTGEIMVASPHATMKELLATVSLIEDVLNTHLPSDCVNPLLDDLELAYQSSPHPIAILNREGGVLGASQSFRSLIPDGVESLWDSIDASMLREHVQDAIRGHFSTLELEIPGRHDVIPLVFSPSSVAGHVVVIPDLMRMLHEEQARYVKAEKLATIGRLSAGIVHELNNPLTSIHVYSEYFLENAERLGLAAADQKRLRRICEGADRISDFVQDLMTYTRPADGAVERIALQKVIDEALGFCEIVIHDHRVKVVCDYEQGCEVEGIRQSFQRIFVNLITNACHAMKADEGETDREHRRGTIEISMRNDEAQIEVRIKDNGVGISKESQPRVFEPFFSTKEEGKGTGLGLSIVRSLVHQHRGSIHLHSTEGDGATFVLYFPVA